MSQSMTFFAVLVLLTCICCDAKFWRNAVNSLSDDVMERQSCPNPSTCPSGSSTCASQNCPNGQKCCIDFVRGTTCCLGAVTTTSATTTASPSGTSVPTCPIGVDGGSFCLASAVCEGAQDCYPTEICCTLRDLPNPFPCCISNTRPTTTAPAGF